MGREYIRLSFIDKLLHFGISLVFVLLTIIIIARLIYIGSLLELWFIPLLIFVCSLLPYFIQRDKLRLEYIACKLSTDQFKGIINHIVKDLKWTIVSMDNQTLTIRTNPGFVNKSYGQHVTIRLIDNGVLVNSIDDPSKGSYLISYGTNKKNISDIKRMIVSKASR